MPSPPFVPPFEKAASGLAYVGPHPPSFDAAKQVDAGPESVWEQFPMGLSIDVADGTEGVVYLSWGERDQYSVLSRICLDVVLGMLQSVR